MGNVGRMFKVEVRKVEDAGTEGKSLCASIFSYMYSILLLCFIMFCTECESSWLLIVMPFISVLKVLYHSQIHNVPGAKVQPIYHKNSCSGISGS